MNPLRPIQITLGIAAVAAQAVAQVAPLPGTVQPGQLERQFQDPPTPRAQPAEINIPSIREAPPADPSAPRFLVSRVIVDRGARYSDAAHATITDRLIGREVSIADIHDVAAALTRRYRADGLVLTQVVVPEQTIRAGVLRLLVIEGYIESVRLEGAIPGSRGLVEAYAERIRETRPLTASALERHLLLMNDLAGATARATIMPATGAAEGAATLLIQFTQKHVAAGVAVDNRGGRLIGPVRGTIDLELNSVLGYRDRTAVKVVTTGDRELLFGSVIHEAPVNTYGGKLGFAGTAVRSEPALAGQFGPANLESRASSGAVSYQHPVVRGRAENLNLRASLGAHDGKTSIPGFDEREDRLRVVRLALTYDRADTWQGLNIAELELAQGLNALGAKRSGEPGLSRPDGRSDFTKITLYAARLQSLAPRWSLLGALAGQYAFNPLLASELFAHGGEQFGRGYDPSEITGDSGVSTKLELRYADRTSIAWFDSYTAYGFYDYGRVYRRVPLDEPATASAASAGLGLRFSLGRTFSGFVEAAKPLTRDVRAEGDRDLRWYAGLAARF